jgi:hypothetical protein
MASAKPKLRLPKSDWIPFSEAREMVVRLTGKNPNTVGDALISAFRDENIRTRGRSEQFFGHDSKEQLGEDIWDLMNVDLGTGSFCLPPSMRFSWSVFERGGVFTDVEVNREDLEKWLGVMDKEGESGGSEDLPGSVPEVVSESPKVLEGAGNPESKPSGNTVDVGGRPMKFDWDAFWIELVRIADMPDGLDQETQSSLVKKMLDWCGEHWMDSPGETTVKNRIRRLLKAIREGGAKT